MGVGAKVPAVSQLEDSTYGRVFRHLARGAAGAEEIARGFRNPQGIAFDRRRARCGSRTTDRWAATNST